MIRTLSLAATLALAMAGVAHAEDPVEQGTTGAITGGVTGAAAGAIVGGPVGAVVGGAAGAMIGSQAAVPEPAREYVIAHPTTSVTIDGELAAGYVIPETVEIQPIPDHAEFGYVYVEERPVIVRLESREVVYVPG